jgi:hypothetical protein
VKRFVCAGCVGCRPLTPSVLAVLPGFNGFLRTSFAGLLHPAANPGVHLVRAHSALSRKGHHPRCLPFEAFLLLSRCTASPRPLPSRCSARPLLTKDEEPQPQGFSLLKSPHLTADVAADHGWNAPLGFSAQVRSPPSFVSNSRATRNRKPALVVPTNLNRANEDHAQSGNPSSRSGCVQGFLGTDASAREWTLSGCAPALPTFHLSPGGDAVQGGAVSGST